jgi:hypothetical protein
MNVEFFTALLLKATGFADFLQRRSIPRNGSPVALHFEHRKTDGLRPEAD